MGGERMPPRWWEPWPADGGRSAPAEERVVRAIRLERARQVEKHGLLSVSSPAVTDAERLAILVEEVGEVARAMTYDNGNEDELIAELVQVAAVAVGWVASRAASPGA